MPLLSTRMRPSDERAILTAAPRAAGFPPAGASAAAVAETTPAAASAINSLIQCFIENLLGVERLAREPRLEVIGSGARQRGQLAKVAVRRGGDADDQLSRVGLAVDEAEQLVADCRRETI